MVTTFRYPDRPLQEGERPLIVEQADAFRRQLDDGLATSNRRMFNAYETTMRRLDSDLTIVQKMIQDRVDAELPVPVSWLVREERYNTLLIQASLEYQKFGIAAYEETNRQVDDAVERAMYRDAPALIRAQLPPNNTIQGQLIQLPKSAVVEFQAQIHDRYDPVTGAKSPVSDLFDSYGPEARQIMDEEITSGLVRGDHPEQVFKAVRDRLGSTFVARAMTTIRTETYRAYRESNRRVYRENEHLVPTWIWNAYAGEYTCVVCWAMHGTEHPVDEPMGSHPNCRCTMVPKTVSWADLGFPGLEQYETPRIPTGEELFARLPESQQRKILGPKKFSHYKNDGMKLSDMVNTRTTRRWGTTRSVASINDSIRNQFDREDLEALQEQQEQVLQAIAASPDPDWLKEVKRIRQKTDKGVDDYTSMGNQIRRQLENDGVIPANIDELASEYQTLGVELTAAEKRLKFLRRNRADQIRDPDERLYEEYENLKFRRYEIERRQRFIDDELAYKPLSPEAIEIRSRQMSLKSRIRETEEAMGMNVRSQDWYERDRLARLKQEMEYDEWQATKQFREAVEYRTYADDVVRYLSDVREMGRKNITTKVYQGSNDTIRQVWDEALEYYPTDWVRTSANGRPIQFRKTNRGYYQEWGAYDEVVTSGGTRESQLNTMIHEAGHRFENLYPDLVKAERDFYNYRTQGEKLQKLKTLTGGNYRAQEVARPDRFYNPYIGKDYGGGYYEIATMGFQAVLDPSGPARMNKPIYRDPEMIDFILGLLAGL